MKQERFPLAGGLYLDTRVNAQIEKLCLDNLRDWDRKEASFGEGSVFSSHRQAAVWTLYGDLLGIWESLPLEDLPPTARAWTWLTTTAVENHKLAYCKSAKRCVAAWWALEDPAVTTAYIAVIEGHRQAEEYLKRFVGHEFCTCVGAFEPDNTKFNLWRFDRPQKKEV